MRKKVIEIYKCGKRTKATVMVGLIYGEDLEQQ